MMSLLQPRLPAIAIMLKYQEEDNADQKQGTNYK